MPQRSLRQLHHLSLSSACFSLHFWRLLRRLAETLTLKTVKFKGPFGEVELTPEKVHRTLTDFCRNSKIRRTSSNPATGLFSSAFSPHPAS